MEVKAKLSYLRIAPRKVRMVADLIRGKKLEEAQAILAFTVKGAVEPITKLLKSAAASAVNDFQMQESNLYVSKITVDEGPKLKRWRPRARGRAFGIQKKTSHIIITLDEIKKEAKKKVEKGVKKTKKKKKAEQEIKKIAKPETEKPKTEAKETVEKSRPQKSGSEVQKPTTPMGAKRFFRRKSF